MLFFFPQNSEEKEKRKTLIRRRSWSQLFEGLLKTETEPGPIALLVQMNGEISGSTNVFHNKHHFHLQQADVFSEKLQKHVDELKTN